jgi:transcriptional regulator with XRE-family HTH domain
MSFILSCQVRAAKSMLRWSGDELAKRSGLSLSTIRRVESAEGIPDAQTVKTLVAIKEAFEAAGIEFIGTPEDGPGVILRRR